MTAPPGATWRRRHIPDILDVIAQLSSDEVHTPPHQARALLDILPEHVWSDPTCRWLDPGSKSGAILREVARRLMDGLAEWEPDRERRAHHILTQMIYGCAITRLTGEMTRRSVYESRDASGEHSLVRFDDEAGNLPFVAAEHPFAVGRDGKSKGPCRTCGAPLGLERGPDRENYAYAFIHGAYPTKEMKDMRFDVIVGNPPYQTGMRTESGSRTANVLPLYHHFIDQAIALDPRYIAMIVPSRWFSGGKGLDEFRARMIADRRLRVIVDNPKIYDVFPDAKIRGGVNFFLWDRDYAGDCTFSTRIDGQVISTMTRDLRDGDGVLLRDNRAATIVAKVTGKMTGSLADVVSPRDPFGQSITTNFRGAQLEPFDGSIPLVFGAHVGYVHPDRLERHHDWVDRFKVLLPMASSGDTTQDSEGQLTDVVLGEPIALAPGSACTQTYLVAGLFDTAQETINYANYLATKFVRFLVLQRKATQHLRPDKFRFVPSLSMSRPWTDADLYATFDLTPAEIDYIEACIKDRSTILNTHSPIPDTHIPGGRKYRRPGTRAAAQAEAPDVEDDE